MVARKLALCDAFVDVGRGNNIGMNADPRQEVEAARARRGKDEPHRFT
jgi:hypothetical protein